MKYCKKCGLSVNTNNNFCPLCAGGLTGVNENRGEMEKFCDIKAADPAEEIYPKGEIGAKYDVVLRLFLFLTVVAVSACLLINILAYNGVLWSFIVIAGIGFLWAAIGYPLLVKKNIGNRITVDAVCAVVFFIVVQVVTHSKGWSLDYVIPFLFIAATTVISLIILIRRMTWREYTKYQFITIFLGLLPVISVIANLVNPIWPSIASAVYSFVTFMGMFIFADKKYKNELIKRFHF
jgi:hypothetical protein